MSFSVVFTRAAMGMNAPLVRIETHLSRGLPGFSMVGLPAAVVKESKDRVRSAILNSHFEFPISRIIVNLAPADVPKFGSRFDLAIAIGILAASRQVPLDKLEQFEFAGELALSGELHAIHGALCFALETRHAKRQLILPCANIEEAGLAKNVTLFPAKHLLAVSEFLNQGSGLTAFEAQSNAPVSSTAIKSPYDYSEVHGQLQAKRALEIAAAGGHHLLLNGSPGVGKTMLAMRFPTILPALSQEEALEVAAIRSITTKNFQDHFFQLQTERPFRAPHHTATSAALVGGGNPPQPGEVSLAHRGVLFLDELPEFNRAALEALREPLEAGCITISRAAMRAQFPTSFQLIAAMNPCPCGYEGDQFQHCQCSEGEIRHYQNKISGPLMDRIDLHVRIHSIATSARLEIKNIEESSAVIQSRVLAARAQQLQRQQCINAQLDGQTLQQVCQLGSEDKFFLEQALIELKLSARALQRVLRVARTIADLAGHKIISRAHLAEAFSYRPALRARW